MSWFLYGHETWLVAVLKGVPLFLFMYFVGVLHPELRLLPRDGRASCSCASARTSASSSPTVVGMTIFAADHRPRRSSSRRRAAGAVRLVDDPIFVVLNYLATVLLHHPDHGLQPGRRVALADAHHPPGRRLRDDRRRDRRSRMRLPLLRVPAHHRPRGGRGRPAPHRARPPLSRRSPATSPGAASSSPSPGSSSARAREPLSPGGPLAFGDCDACGPSRSASSGSPRFYVVGLSAVRWWTAGLRRRGVADAAARDWYLLAGGLGPRRRAPARVHARRPFARMAT